MRLFAVLRVQPLWRQGLGQVWVPVALVLAGLVALPLASQVTAVTETSASQWVLLGLAEFVLGTVIGVLASLPGHALIGATHSSAQWLRAPRGPLGALGVCLTLATALALRLHEPALYMLVDLTHVFPIGRPAAWFSDVPQLLPALLGATAAMLVLGLALAAPVLLCTAVIKLASAVIGRGPAPASAIAEAGGAWAAAAGALIALGASWAVYAHAWAQAILPTTLTQGAL